MPMGRKPNEERRREVRQLRAAGYTYAEIMERTGMSLAGVIDAIRPNRRYKVQQFPVRCWDCDADLNRAAAWRRHDRQVLCLACLEKHPAAPFREWLRAHRIAAGLQAKELARLAAVSSERLYEYETGGSTPPGWTWRRLAKVLPGLRRGPRK